LSSTTVKLWRVSDGSRLRTLEGLTNYVYSVAFSPDGQIVAAWHIAT
jgi:WD40 repeat protein